ncbi:MAG: PAC2 family protein [Chloroflexota bacterium]
MSQSHPFVLKQIPEMRSPSLLVGWRQDAGRLGLKVLDYWGRKLGCQEFAEISLPDFFPLSGVSVEDDVVQFPESKFYWSQESETVLFLSDTPGQEYYRFLNAVLDVAQLHCKVKQVYVIGGMVSMLTHAAPRRVLGVVNQPQLKEALRLEGIDTSMEYRTPRGSSPTISSYLLWLAGRRSLPGANLWGEVSFYLAAGDDPWACKRMLTALGRRLDLQVDMADVDADMTAQAQKLDELKAEDQDINKCLEMLERGIMLNEEESENLVRMVTEHLQRKS